MYWDYLEDVIDTNQINYSKVLNSSTSRLVSPTIFYISIVLVEDLFNVTFDFYNLLFATLHYTAIPYRVEQGGCREVPVLKTGSLQWEQDPCNKSRFFLW